MIIATVLLGAGSLIATLIYVLNSGESLLAALATYLLCAFCGTLLVILPVALKVHFNLNKLQQTDEPALEEASA